ncbi:MAG TPA: pilus assembly protein [Bryobacteraceae bacterium]|nr:pilus assembly protein [Bryobacteraceae bacterium]HPQ17036.1 pilus assembly protein [Bryobacteraceae bacterium]HPU71321.1 pilus assembly protein [Bryobacteraceae bacterium]
MVEFALAVPLLTVLFLGTFQYGYAFFLYSELEKSVRAGARYASVRTYSPPTVEAGADPASADPDYVDAVRDTVLYGDITTKDITVVPGLRPEHIVVTMPEYSAGPTRVRVCINGYSVGFFWPVQMNNKPCVEFPYVGNFAPRN